MARKATPEELAIAEAAEKNSATFEQLAEQLETGDGAAVDNTQQGDANKDTVAPDVKPARKRGRPSNAEKALNDVLDKENPSDAIGEQPQANKPGRKPGKKTQPSGAALGKQLVGIHALAAMMLQLPEIQLRDDEGEALGNAVVAVCEEYNLSVSGKTGAAIQLLAAAAMIYAPRALMVKMRLDAARAAQQPVAEFRGANLHVVTPGSN